MRRDDEGHEITIIDKSEKFLPTKMCKKFKKKFEMKIKRVFFTKKKVSCL